MRPITTIVVELSVCWSVSPAKAVELILLPFGMLTWVGPMNHVLDGGPDLSMQKHVTWCLVLAVCQWFIS